MELSPEIFVLLFFIAAIAGWVDVIAGGGGLLIIPILVLTGMPPAVAIATNKLQGSVGTLIATVYFVRKRVVDLARMKLAIGMTFIGSIFGSWLVLQVEAQKLLWILLILLPATGLYFLFAPNLDDTPRPPKSLWQLFFIIITFALGCYDGFFGPGAGSFMALAFVLGCGYALPTATAHAKVLNFTSNISALLYFIFYGEIAWAIGVTMIGGQMVGATCGAKMVLQRGSTLIKPMVVTVCIAITLGILIKYW